MTVHDVDQNSREWLELRAGKATASRFADIIGKNARGTEYLKARETYMLEVVTEMLTGQPASEITSKALQWGKDHEQIAREVFEERTGIYAEPVGFVQHDTLLAGASPDGLIDWDGGWECKCPVNSMNHVQTLLHGMPMEHMAQVQGNMWITKREFWIFASFDPRMPEDLDLYTQRIERDESYIAMLESEVEKFLKECIALADKLRMKMEK